MQDPVSRPPTVRSGSSESVAGRHGKLHAAAAGRTALLSRPKMGDASYRRQIDAWPGKGIQPGKIGAEPNNAKLSNKAKAFFKAAERTEAVPADRIQYKGIEKRFLEVAKSTKISDAANEMGRGQNYGPGVDTVSDGVRAAVDDAWHMEQAAYTSLQSYSQVRQARDSSGGGLKRTAVWIMDGDTSDGLHAAAATREKDESFSFYQNYALQWRRRYTTKQRFIRAAQTVLLRLKAEKILERMRVHYADWRRQLELARSGYASEERCTDEMDAVSLLNSWQVSSVLDSVCAAEQARKSEYISAELVECVHYQLPGCALPALSNDLEDCSNISTELKSRETPLALSPAPDFDALFTCQPCRVMDDGALLFRSMESTPLAIPRPGPAKYVHYEGGEYGTIGEPDLEDASVVLSMPDALEHLPYRPPLHPFYPAPNQGRYALPMLVNEVHPDFHLSTPIQRTGTSITDRMHHLLEFQHGQVSSLNRSDWSAPLAAAWRPSSADTPAFRSHLGPPPSEMDELAVGDINHQPGMEPPGRLTVDRALQSFSLPTDGMDVARSGNLLSKTAFLGRAAGNRMEHQQALDQQAFSGTNRLGAEVQARLEDYVSGLPPQHADKFLDSADRR